MVDDVDAVSKAHLAGIDLDYRAPELSPAVRELLPEPVLPAHENWLTLYWRAWAIAYDQRRDPESSTGLVPFCDAAFSNNIFQWDTCFMVGFLRYAPDLLRAQGSLDNFYRKQHANGFICREINAQSGVDCWGEDHPSAVNPPLFAVAEWNLYLSTGDAGRLREVLAPICRYDRWLRDHRRARGGVGYWTTALASGMDNSPRTRSHGRDVHDGYGYVWLCLTAQQALASQAISAIARVVGDEALAHSYAREARRLTEYLDQNLWNRQLRCYGDRTPEGTVTDVLTPACCWPLLLDDVDPAHRMGVLSILQHHRHFWRPHGMPSLAASDPEYAVEGNYWLGSVWPPMVQLAVWAMLASKQRAPAQALVTNHLNNLDSVFRTTGTLWENYRPEEQARGNIARPEFVGWTGCGPIGMLLEVILGFEVNAPARTVTWNLSRADTHGVRRLPIGDTHVSLEFDAGQIVAATTAPITLRIEHEGRCSERLLEAGTARWLLP